MFFLENNPLEHRCRCHKGGGSSASTSATTSNTSTSSAVDNSTTDNRTVTTVTGDGVNGSGNTIQRADAGVLNATAGLLGDISFDMNGTMQKAFDNGSALVSRGFDSADRFAEQVDKTTTAILGQQADVRRAEQEQQKGIIDSVTKSFVAAKNADSAQVSALAGETLKAASGNQRNLLIAVAVGVLGLVAIIFRKK